MSNNKKTSVPQSKYAGVGAARAQRPANYYRPGLHALVRVLKIEEGEDRFKVGLVAMQGSVIFSFEDSANGANAVGEEVSEVIKRNNVAFASRLKAVAMAVGDLTEADFESQEYDGQIFDELVSDDQPGAGVVLEVRTSEILKQNAANKATHEPKDFYTRVDFIRRVPFSEVKEILATAGVSEDIINRRVPNINEEIEREEAEAAGQGD